MKGFTNKSENLKKNKCEKDTRTMKNNKVIVNLLNKYSVYDDRTNINDTYKMRLVTLKINKMRSILFLRKYVSLENYDTMIVN